MARPWGFRHRIRSFVVPWWRRLKRAVRAIRARYAGETPQPTNDPHPTVGRCIYCGTQEGDLTDEHVIAEALNGTIILRKASCHDCQTCTTRAETHCFHTMFKALRTRGKFASKSGPLPEALEVVVTDATGAREKIVVPVEEHPSGTLIIGHPPPRLLKAEFPAWAYEGYRVWAFGNSDHMRRLAQAQAEGKKIGFASFHPLHFARMLAKTAHAFAVYRRGYGSFEPLVTDLIREKTAEYAEFVGVNPTSREPPGAGGFRMKLVEHTIGDSVYLVANVQLFPRLSTPVFHVVVGKLKGRSDERAAL